MTRTSGLFLAALMLLGSEPAWAACPTLNDEEAATSIEQDLNGTADESPSYRKHISGRGAQHKVWWDDYNNRWSAIMWDKASQRFEIFYRSSGTTWTSTNVSVHHSSESGAAMYRRRFDTMYAPCGPTLYVLSHEFDETPSAGGTGSENPMYLFAFDVDAGYTLITGFPVLVEADLNVEAASLAFANDGRVFVTWARPTGDATRKGVVEVASTTYGQAQECMCGTAGNCEFNEKMVVAAGISDDACDAGVTWDDIAVGFPTRPDRNLFPNSSDAFGVLWSNQDPASSCSNSRFSYRYFVGGALGDDANWSAVETAYSGSYVANDHISVVDYAAGAFDAAVTAVVQTSKTSSSDPLMVLLNRNPSGRCSDDHICIGGGGAAEGGACSTDAQCAAGWSTYTIETVSSNHTRPALVLDYNNECLYYFATDNDGDNIVERHTNFVPNNPTISWSAQNTVCDESNKINNVSGPRVQDMVRANLDGADTSLVTLAASYEHSDDGGYYCVSQFCAGSLPCD
jgi:hypothetical protein